MSTRDYVAGSTLRRVVDRDGMFSNGSESDVRNRPHERTPRKPDRPRRTRWRPPVAERWQSPHAQRSPCVGNGRGEHTPLSVTIAPEIAAALRWPIEWLEAAPLLVVISVGRLTLYRSQDVDSTILLCKTRHLLSSGRVMQVHLRGPQPASGARRRPALVTHTGQAPGSRRHPQRTTSPWAIRVLDESTAADHSRASLLRRLRCDSCREQRQHLQVPPSAAVQIADCGALGRTKHVGCFVLEVRGDVCNDAYVAVRGSGARRYSLPHVYLDTYADAHRLAWLSTNVSGHGQQPIRRRDHTDRVECPMLLCRVADDYMMLFVVSVCAISPDHVSDVIARVETQATAGTTKILVVAAPAHRLDATTCRTLGDAPYNGDCGHARSANAEPYICRARRRTSTNLRPESYDAHEH